MFDRHPWKKAAFLHERLIPGGVMDSAARERATQRLKTWRDGMMNPGAHARHLEDAGLSEEELLGLLADEEVTLDERRADLTWLPFLEQLAQGRHRDEPLPPLAIQPVPGMKARPAFTRFSRPFLQIAAARLRRGLAELQERHPGPPLLGAGVEATLLLKLHEQLSMMATRVLLLELNVARVMGELSGDTPEERFESFFRAFEDTGRLLAFLQEYPVLARLMVNTVERWVKVNLELLERIAVDRPALGQRFLGGEPVGEVSTVSMGVGDVHRGGRSVVHVTFSSGLKLVYKPRSLGIDVAFQGLLEWLNGRGVSAPHRTIRVLDRGTHGWVEFVTAGECDSREALQRFYRRQGSHLALLYLVRAVDLHMENVIAAGEHPVVVDLEALFYHEPSFEYGQDAYYRALAVLDQSVLSIGLLPNFQLSSAEKSVDLSGMGGQGGKTYPHPVLGVEDMHQDTMRLVRRETTTSGASNLPRLQGRAANAADFVEEMAEGFEETYQLLVRHRAEVEEQLRGFADVEVRHLLRPTFRYGFILQESQHPDFLRDGLDFERLLDLLWSETKVRPLLNPMVRHEKEDLRAGDVPLFTSRPGSRDLWTSTGTRVPDFFSESSLTSVLQRLARMGPEDCAEQLLMIRRAMVALEKETDGVSASAKAEPAPALPPPSREELLAAAVEIGEYLERRAILGESNATWIGASLNDLEQWRWSLAPVRTSLYEGVGGIALFFGYLAAATGRASFERMARMSLETILKYWRTPGGLLDFPGVGPYLGRSSHLYVMSHLATLFDDKALMDEALDGLPTIGKLIPEEKNVDVLTGSAGCARVMLGLHKLTGDARALELARRCGERIMKAAVPARGGLGWTTIAAPEKPLGGFSHGVAGFSWVLLELAAATGESHYREAALQGLGYERTLFVPERGNWLDLRFMSDDPAKAPAYLPTAWCNGASGIALGRALSLAHVDDGQMREEIRIGLESTLRQGSGPRSHSLCHGAMGNVDIFCTAADALQEGRWREVALAQAAQVLKEGREGGWRCGLPKYNETPGMMLGLAGIGLSFLRLRAPDEVPSVLSLEPPRGRARA